MTATVLKNTTHAPTPPRPQAEPVLVQPRLPDPTPPPTPAPVVLHPGPDPLPPAATGGGGDSSGDALDRALESLDAWVELGEELRHPLVKRREQLLFAIEDHRRQLRKVEMALRILGVGDVDPESHGALPPTRSKGRGDDVRSMVHAVLSGQRDALTFNQIAELVTERDPTLDRYELSNMLPRMQRVGEVMRVGKRGAYRYLLPPP